MVDLFSTTSFFLDFCDLQTFCCDLPGVPGSASRYLSDLLGHYECTGIYSSMNDPMLVSDELFCIALLLEKEECICT